MREAAAATADPPPGAVGLREATAFWFRLGCLSFGGPAGQIALMHEELVVRRRWIGEERFLHALNYCMLLPGPEAMQLATYVGWLLHRSAGGLLAGALFVLPGALVVFALSWIYAAFGRLAPVDAVFYGLRAGVVAIVAAALVRIGARTLRRPATAGLAISSFVALFVYAVPFPLVVATAGVLGLIAARWMPEAFAGEPHANPAAGTREALISDRAPLPPHARPSPTRLLRTAAIGLAVWWAPLLLVAAWRGRDGVIADEAFFFSRAAMVTFGGAYAVLSYVNQAAVGRFGWLLPGQMLDGLGLAESTPGPLILVLQFVGFLAAWRNPGSLAPLAAAVLGTVVTLWATFAPCFLWIFAGAPYLERLRSDRRLAGALAAITAAVVGVVANLALWFAIHVFFGEVGAVAFGSARVPVPRPASLDPWSVALATVAFYGLWKKRWNVVWVVVACALAGLLIRSTV